MKKKRLRPQYSLVALTAVVATAVLLSLPMFHAAQKPAPIAGLGGTFELVNQHGEIVTEKNFLGKPSLYFFGFTHCPDVCPTTLLELSQILKELGSNAPRLNVIFVSVDPARDTPQVLKDYLQAFDPRIIGLTGSEAQVEKITKAFHVYAKKTPTEGGSYSVDHTASVFALNEKGEVVMIIGYGEAPAMMREKLKRLLS